MRITKKLLKKAKEGFQKRAKELFALNKEELKAEIKRTFKMDFTWNQNELLKFCILDLLDLSFPDHWWQ